MKCCSGLLALLAGLYVVSGPSIAAEGVPDTEVVALVDALEQARSSGVVSGLQSENWDRLSRAMLDAVHGDASSDGKAPALETIRGGLFAELTMAHGKTVAATLKHLGLPATTDLGSLVGSGDAQPQSEACISVLLTAQGLILEAMVVCQSGSTMECGSAIVRAAVAHANAQSACGQYISQY